MVIKQSKPIEICNHYTDIKKQLYIKTLCDLFNDVANEQTLLWDVDVDTFNAQGITWMLHKLHIQVLRLPVKGEQVVLETWPAGADRLFAYRDFRIVNDQGEELVKLTSQWMVIDLERRRPVRLPESVLKVYELCKDVIRQLDFELDHRSFPEDFTGTRHFSATYDNIDFNQHVTQASYVGWITNAMPYDFLKSHELRELEVVYEHEILPDSTINSVYKMEAEGEEITIYHRVINQEGDKNHCVAKSKWIFLPHTS